MILEFARTEELSERQNTSLDKLGEAVYPLEVAETPPGRFFTWASPQWSLLLWEEDELITHVGLLVRDIFQDGIPKRIGGIGSVATHPEKQGLGFGSRAMRAAAEKLALDLKVSYAVLFCRPHLIGFYERLNWKLFQGKIFVEQPQGRMEFSVNKTMVLDVREQAPLAGTLDLNGLPW